MGLVKECQPLYHAGRIYPKYPPSVERSRKLSKGGIIVLALVSFQFSSVFIQYNSIEWRTKIVNKSRKAALFGVG